jgi:hypothetical protein
MLITFKSKACGDVMMFGEVAHKLMEAMGKEPAEKGIVTVEQLPEAIARLKRFAEAERARDASLPPPDREEEVRRGPRVGLAQRAFPLIEMLELSLEAEQPVIWGV